MKTHSFYTKTAIVTFKSLRKGVKTTNDTKDTGMLDYCFINITPRLVAIFLIYMKMKNMTPGHKLVHTLRMTLFLIVEIIM